MQKPNIKKPNIKPAGFSIMEWTTGVGIGYSTYFTIAEEFLPRRARIGDRVIIIESPIVWLERIAVVGAIPKRQALGGVPSKQAA